MPAGVDVSSFAARADKEIDSSNEKKMQSLLILGTIVILYPHS